MKINIFPVMYIAMLFAAIPFITKTAMPPKAPQTIFGYPVVEDYQVEPQRSSSSSSSSSSAAMTDEVFNTLLETFVQDISKETKPDALFIENGCIWNLNVSYNQPGKITRKLPGVAYGEFQPFIDISNLATIQGPITITLAKPHGFKQLESLGAWLSSNIPLPAVAFAFIKKFVKDVPGFSASADIAGLVQNLFSKSITIDAKQHKAGDILIFYWPLGLALTGYDPTIISLSPEDYHFWQDSQNLITKILTSTTKASITGAHVIKDFFMNKYQQSEQNVPPVRMTGDLKNALEEVVVKIYAQEAQEQTQVDQPEQKQK